MKKVLICFLLVVMVFMPFGALAENVDLAKNAKSAMLIDAATGEIFFEKNADERLAPASMTKMMSLLLFMEAIEKGSLTMDEKVKASAYASSMGGSQIFLEPGEEMTVTDLLKGITIGSANDATVVLAERVGGTETAFVAMMNKKAKELGLTNTNFMNTTGLDAENHYSSARDMALIAKELVKHETILDFSSIYETYLRENTDNKFWLVNTNKLVRFYDGVDGLKTGYTSTAGYCLTATLEKNNLRVIAVVMGEASSSTRNSEVSDMLDYAYNMYEGNVLFSKDDIVTTIDVDKATKDSVDVVPLNDIVVTIKKGEDTSNINYKVALTNAIAPIKVRDVIGSIDVIKDGNVILTEKLTVKEEVKKSSIFQLFVQNFKDIVIGNLRLG